MRPQFFCFHARQIGAAQSARSRHSLTKNVAESRGNLLAVGSRMAEVVHERVPRRELFHQLFAARWRWRGSPAKLSSFAQERSGDSLRRFGDGFFGTTLTMTVGSFRALGAGSDVKADAFGGTRN